MTILKIYGFTMPAFTVFDIWVSIYPKLCNFVNFFPDPMVQDVSLMVSVLVIRANKCAFFPTLLLGTPQGLIWWYIIPLCNLHIYLFSVHLISFCVTPCTTVLRYSTFLYSSSNKCWIIALVFTLINCETMVYEKGKH